MTYQDIIIKGSHNSYEHKSTFAQQLTFYQEKPYFGGVLNIEFDIVVNPDKLKKENKWEFGLQHAGPFSPNSMSLQQGLKELLEWHNEMSDHQILAVYVDVKHDCAIFGNHEDFVKELDRQILEILDKSLIYTPKELKGGFSNLLESVQKKGYPLLSELKNKFIFVLTGEEKDRYSYERKRIYNQQLDQRLMFVDIDHRIVDQLDQYLEVEKNRVFLSAGCNQWVWQKHVSDSRKNNIITRAYFVNEEYLWDECIQLGVNIIATDQIFSKKWACF